MVVLNVKTTCDQLLKSSADRRWRSYFFRDVQRLLGKQLAAFRLYLVARWTPSEFEILDEERASGEGQNGHGLGDADVQGVEEEENRDEDKTENE